MATIANIQSRISTAVHTLVDADRNNPATMLTSDQIRANPYWVPKGDNGAVDKNEAKGVADNFARSVFEAASFASGEHILTGGTDKLVEATMPKWEVPIGEIRQFQSHVNAIVAGLETDAAGEVTPQALEGLPAKVADYFKQAYGNVREQPRADAVDRIVAMVREAASGVVDWH